MCNLHISAHMVAQKIKRVNDDKKTHISVWIEGWEYNRIQEEIEAGDSDSESQVVRKALHERFKPKNAW